MPHLSEHSHEADSMSTTRSKTDFQLVSGACVQESLFPSTQTEQDILSSISDILLEKEYLRRNYIAPGQPIKSAKAAASYIKSKLVLENSRERFLVLFLNAQNCVIELEQLFVGSLDTAAIYPRELIGKVLHYNAANLILAHCHPSGSLSPSNQDRNITRKLVDGLALIDVKVLDHIIIAYGKTEYTSMAEMGLM